MSGFGEKDKNTMHNLEESQKKLRANYLKELQKYKDHVNKHMTSVSVYPLYLALETYKNCQLKIKLAQLMLSSDDLKLSKIYSDFMNNPKLIGGIYDFNAIFNTINTYVKNLRKSNVGKENLSNNLKKIKNFAVKNHLIAEKLETLDLSVPNDPEDSADLENPENLFFPKSVIVFARILNQNLLSLDSTHNSESVATRTEIKKDSTGFKSVSSMTSGGSGSIYSAKPHQEDVILTGISKHQLFVQDPTFRMKLFEKFVPTFYFHKDEKNFPLNPDDYIKEVITVKRDIYIKLLSQRDKDKDKDKYKDIEKELKVINDYLWTDDGKFSYSKALEKEVEFKDKLKKLRDVNIDLFTFDEKKHGYKDGSRIKSLPGVLPKGYPGHDESKSSPPLISTAIATEEGFFLRFEYSYALNNVIPGLGWLRKILPWSLAEKLDQVGFHYGDCEGVGVYLKYDEKTHQASVSALQTFAHGRRGARIAPVDQCTVKDGHLSVFVGLGGHPSYADNFVLRNRFFDKVGDKWKIAPQPEALVDGTLIIGHTGDEDKTSNYDEDNTVPKIHLLSPRMACANNMLYDTPKTDQELKSAKIGDGKYSWDHYHPNLFFTKIYHKIKNYINKHFYHKPLDTTKLPVVVFEDTKAEAGQIVKCLTFPHGELTPESSTQTLIVPEMPHSSPKPSNN